MINSFFIQKEIIAIIPGRPTVNIIVQIVVFPANVIKTKNAKIEKLPIKRRNYVLNVKTHKITVANPILVSANPALQYIPSLIMNTFLMEVGAH